MIRLNCFIRVTPQHKGELLAIAKRLTEASREQDGCIAYDIFESATNIDVLMICETWRDQMALDAHKASSVFKLESPKMHALAEMKLESFEF